MEKSNLWVEKGEGLCCQWAGFKRIMGGFGIIGEWVG